ncbi:GAF and ANTAR domain-containing protein [Streptomyces flavofungini]|uniref:GAF and ANTAR domain-containing protein n=1 Tax=Streptomyces flavofungini TaxID=68200 RepID=UPI0034E02E90
MSREESITRTFVELADTLADDFDVTAYVRQLTRRCRDILGVADAVVLLAFPGTGTPGPVTYGDDPALAPLLDAATRVGPAVDAHATGTTVAPGDLARAPGAWHDFTALARHAGYTHAAAVPLRLRQETLGSLLLLRTGESPLAADDLDLARAFAEAAAIGLLHAHSFRQADTLNEQLHKALQSRVMIEQAKGFLAARHGMSPVDAFETLRRHARSSRLPLATVAQEVITTKGLPPQASSTRRPDHPDPDAPTG